MNYSMQNIIPAKNHTMDHSLARRPLPLGHRDMISPLAKHSSQLVTAVTKFYEKTWKNMTSNSHSG